MPQTRALLAEQGTTLADFFVTTPVCCPSRSSILSGRMAHNTGATTNGCGRGHFWEGPGLSSTVATFLQTANYTTGLFGKELNAANYTAISPGWDRYFALGQECQYYGNSWADQGRKTTSDAAAYMTHVIGNATVQWLRAVRARGRAPFFAYVAPHAPHQPAEAAPEHAAAFAGRKAPRTPAWNASCPEHHWVVGMQPPLTAAQAALSDDMFERRWRALLSVDELVGALVAEVDAMGELDNTFFLYVRSLARDVLLVLSRSSSYLRLTPQRASLSLLILYLFVMAQQPGTPPITGTTWASGASPRTSASRTRPTCACRSSCAARASRATRRCAATPSWA